LLSIASAAHRDVIVLCLKGYAAARRAGSKDLKALLPWAVTEQTAADDGMHEVAESTDQVLIETDASTIAQETPVSGAATEPVRQAAEDHGELLEELKEMQLAIDMYKEQLSEREATIRERTAALQALQAERDVLNERNLNAATAESAAAQAKLAALQSEVENLSKVCLCTCVRAAVVGR
jgi:hypothetical protein